MENNEHIYVPVIKGKKNDLKALSLLSEKSRAVIKPLVEIMPLAVGTTIEVHLEKFAGNIKKYLPTGPIYVDFYGLMPSTMTYDNFPASIAGYKYLKINGRIVTPVYGFDRDESLWGEIREIVHSFDEGFCFRILVEDIEDSEETWSKIIGRTGEIGITASKVDLLIDLRDIGNKEISDVREVIVDFLSGMPQGHKFRSITIVASSALKTVTDIEKDGWGDIKRNELFLWTELQFDLADTYEIIYGDYGVIHPEFSDSGPTPNKNAKIRYTHKLGIRYFRGHMLADPPGYSQYYELASQVLNSDVYQGKNFSAGDDVIFNSAFRLCGTGSLSTWVQNDMNHHLEFVVRQMTALRKRIQKVSTLDEIQELLLTT